MNKINPIFISFIIIIATLSCCMKSIDSRKITVYNTSSSTVYSIISPNDSIGTSEYYNDFDVPIENPEYTFTFDNIEPGDKVSNHDDPGNWDRYFENIEDKKVRVFIVKKDSVSKYGWKTVFDKNIFDKKYKLSLEDLEESNWELEYQ